MLIDGHVHFHRSYSIERALGAAARNFARSAAVAELASPVMGMMWLAETRHECSSERLRSAETGSWSLTERDAVTWHFDRDRGERLILVRGRQVSTRERLEVVVVGTSEPIADDQPLDATIEPWLERDVLVMLPWSFGKWTGSRRRVVERSYESYGPHGVRLADTGVRPDWLREPKLLHRAAGDDRPVFLGSDPLPFHYEVNRIGSTGFVLDGVDSCTSWTAMHEVLRGLRGSPPRFGSSVDTTSFARLQARMQLRKLFRGRQS